MSRCLPARHVLLSSTDRDHLAPACSQTRFTTAPIWRCTSSVIYQVVTKRTGLLFISLAISIRPLQCCLDSIEPDLSEHSEAFFPSDGSVCIVGSIRVRGNFAVTERD